MAYYTASALSLTLLGFKKPIVLTGSQMPLSSPRGAPTRGRT
jgi:L-asparaginase